MYFEEDEVVRVREARDELAQAEELLLEVARLLEETAHHVKNAKDKLKGFDEFEEIREGLRFYTGYLSNAPLKFKKMAKDLLDLRVKLVHLFHELQYSK